MNFEEVVREVKSSEIPMTKRREGGRGQMAHSKAISIALESQQDQIHTGKN